MYTEYIIQRMDNHLYYTAMWMINLDETWSADVQHDSQKYPTVQEALAELLVIMGQKEFSQLHFTIVPIYSSRYPQF